MLIKTLQTAFCYPQSNHVQFLIRLVTLSRKKQRKEREALGWRLLDNREGEDGTEHGAMARVLFTVEYMSVTVEYVPRQRRPRIERVKTSVDEGLKRYTTFLRESVSQRSSMLLIECCRIRKSVSDQLQVNYCRNVWSSAALFFLFLGNVYLQYCNVVPNSSLRRNRRAVQTQNISLTRIPSNGRRRNAELISCLSELWQLIVSGEYPTPPDTVLAG